VADINDINKIIDKALTKLTAQMNRIEPKFAKLVVEWVSKFRDSGGTIIRSESNLKRLAGFEAAIERFQIRSGYTKSVKEFLKAYPKITSTMSELHKELSGINPTDPKAKKQYTIQQRAAIENTINNLTKQGMATVIINPVRAQLFSAVSQGASLTQTIEALRAQLLTTDKSQGLIKKLALQGSRDALGQYQGSVNAAISNIFEFDAYIYQGSLIKDSRPQCERWVNYSKNTKKGLILKTDLKEEIKWAENNGTGFIEGTTEDTWPINRGGYNCRHTAWPVRSSVYLTKK